MKNQIPTVHELRKKGWKVRVGHHRRFYRFDPQTGKKDVVTILWKEKEEKYPNYYLDASGGYTVVSIKCPLYEEELIGISSCSVQELYNKKVGTKKAIARALSVWFEDVQNLGN